MSRDGQDYADGELKALAKPTMCQILKEEIVMLKWRVLFFACFLTFGSYYIYDFPGSIGTGKDGSKTIETWFKSHGKEYNQVMNQALYSIYSWPNTVLAVFGGLLIDKFLGLRKALMLFVTLVLIGSIIFFIGVTTTTYPLLLFGRLVFGLGGESLSVAQSAFIARWFKNGRGMALAFGITISFARVGSSFNFLFSPKISDSAGVVTASLFGVGACVISLFAAAVLVFLDIYGTRKGIVPPESKETGEPFKLSQIKNMPILFWLASGVCVSVYCSVFPFIGIAVNFFEVKYGLSASAASTYVSIYQFVCAGASPVAGGMVDTVGRFSIWMIVAGSGFTLIHLTFLAASPPPWLMMGIMGVTYSVLVSSLWPAIPYVVQADLVGLAYGIMTAMQNSGLATWPLVSGAILDEFLPSSHNSTKNSSNTSMLAVPFMFSKNSSHDSSDSSGSTLPTIKGYDCTETFFMVTAGAGVLVAIAVFIIDKRGAGVLGASPSKRDRIKAASDPLVTAVDTLPLVSSDVN